MIYSLLTFVAPQHYPELEKSAHSAVDKFGLRSVDSKTLSKDRAYVFLIADNVAKSSITALRAALECDVFVRRCEADTEKGALNAFARRPKLFLSDMDSTIVADETLDELAGEAGLKDKIAELTAATMRGELDFKQSVQKRIALLKNLPLNALDKTVDNLRYSGGARTVMATLKAHDVYCVLVSGGFTFFTEIVANTLGFDEDFGNLLGIDRDRLDGTIIPPILDQSFKADLLDAQMTALGITASQVLCAGDGANDLAMLAMAQGGNGLGIGYHPKPILIEELDNVILYGDLTSLLYAQGYSDDEITHVEA